VNRRGSDRTNERIDGLVTRVDSLLAFARSLGVANYVIVFLAGARVMLALLALVVR